MKDDEVHECDKADEIKEIHAMVTRIDKSLRGNGKPGLFTDMAVLKNTMAGLIAVNVVIIGAIIGMIFK